MHYKYIYYKYIYKNPIILRMKKVTYDIKVIIMNV